MCDACDAQRPTVSRRRLMRRAGGGASGALLAAAGLSLRPWQMVRAQDATPAGEEMAPVEWSYEGETGPAHWGDLDPAFASCSGGTEQSPIDVAEATGADLPNIEFSYQVVSPIHIVNTGETIRVNIPTGSGITLDGKRFGLLQFHFHTPSEHTVNGQGQAMELHLVHAADDGELAVVGVLLSEGGENPALQAVFAAMPVMAGPEQEVTGSVDPNAFLPEFRTIYRYTGSLTTPPCSEGVNWLLMTEPMPVSSAQLAAYRTIYELDARPVQPLNDRTVEEDTTP